MRLWLISLIIGVLALGGIVMATSSGFQDTETQENTKTVDSTNCGYANQGNCGYQNCDAQNNCGRTSCAAVQGTGGCNCG